MGDREAAPGGRRTARELRVCTHAICMCVQQIQALLAPPKADEAEKRSRKPEKEPRRSGRATNHDSCDSCKEGGISCAVITARPPSTSSAGKVWGPLCSPLKDPSRHIPSPGLPQPAEITGACSR